MKWNLFRKLHYFCCQLGSLKFLFYLSFLKQFLHDMFPPHTVFARLFGNEATSSSADLLQWNQSLLSDWLDHNSDIFLQISPLLSVAPQNSPVIYFSIVLNHCHQQSHAFLVSSFFKCCFMYVIYKFLLPLFFNNFTLKFAETYRASLLAMKSPLLVELFAMNSPNHKSS